MEVCRLLTARRQITLCTEISALTALGIVNLNTRWRLYPRKPPVSTLCTLIHPIPYNCHDIFLNQQFDESDIDKTLVQVLRVQQTMSVICHQRAAYTKFHDSTNML